MQPLMDRGGLLKRSQDLPPVYEVSGSLYAIGADLFRQ